MTDIQRGARLHHCSKALEGLSEESVELLRAHIVVLNRKFVFRVAFISAVIGQIAEHQIRGVATHQLGDVGLIGGIANEQLVIS